ncbi:ATP-binding protein [Streptomyces sp. TRM68367]|uniref:ATP-binding protein n=1 Tax=Streptomyces sp. TRM68367 TaxID=2758415 RepID=UPI00165C0D59|nr:ATP-binding protein [Streptomyces sp. TRM68367]MBC9724720.1 GAF domain-containing protein [Streptomyces sp. TRM68367]
MRITTGRPGVCVARRLTIAFGLLIALLLLVGAGGLSAAVMANRLHDRAMEPQPTLRENARVHDQAAAVHRAVRSYLLTGDTGELNVYFRTRDTPFATLAEARRHAFPGARENLAAQERQLRAYVRVADQQAEAAPGSGQGVRLTEEASRLFATFEASNQRLINQLNEESQRLEDRAHRLVDSAIAGTAVALAAGGALAVFAAVHTTRALTRPLRNTARTLGRLAAGEQSARAEEDGPEEIRAVARSVNLLADEGDRLRAIEQERARLSRTARAIGVQIREQLDVEQVLDTACAGIGEGLEADHAFVLLTEQDSPLVCVMRAWSAGRGLLPAQEQPIPPVPLDVVRDHYRRGTAWCRNDLSAAPAEGSPLPGAPGSFGEGGLLPDARAAAEALGLVGVLVIPLGVGDEPLGALFLARTRRDRPWLPVEIEIAESMAAGVGRALHTALLYKKETHLVEKLRALDKAKSDFLSTVSHELRTPLTSIVGYIELLKDEETGPLSPPHQHMLDVVDRNANRLRALIEDLLTLSRIESGAFGSRKEPVDLCRLVASAVDTFRPAAEAASVTLETHWPSSRPLMLEADSDQLDRVLMNLLSNAVKFTPRGGKVTVRAEARDGEAVLSVSDTGIGIPPAEQEKLFQRFFRASNATAAAIPGTGLGLTIVLTIVANHGGEMQVDSEEGRGTTFTARLPLTAASGAAASP